MKAVLRFLLINIYKNTNNNREISMSLYVVQLELLREAV